MEDRLVAEDTSQPERSRDSRDEQPSNMEDRSVAEETSQPETPREVRPDRPLNMEDRSVAPEASTPSRDSDDRAEGEPPRRSPARTRRASAAAQPDRSREETREPQNMSERGAEEEALQPERPRELSDVNPPNSPVSDLACVTSQCGRLSEAVLEIGAKMPLIVGEPIMVHPARFNEIG